MRLYVLTVLLVFLSACSVQGTEEKRINNGFLTPTALSHAPRPVNFEPNDKLSMDHLLAGRIKGKIKQALPEEQIKVLVDGNRIIISSPKREDEDVVKQIRHSVGELSKGRSLVVVSEDVFQLYRNGNKGNATD